MPTPRTRAPRTLILSLAAALALGALPAVGLAQDAPAQAGKPAPALSPTGEKLLQAEQLLWEAIKQRQWDVFENTIAGMTYMDLNGVVDAWKKGTAAQAMADVVTSSYELSDVRERFVTPDVVILTYTATYEQTAGGNRTPSPSYMLSVWQKKGNKWVPVAHSESLAATAK